VVPLASDQSKVYLEGTLGISFASLRR
jgi:hypothetical protein